MNEERHSILGTGAASAQNWCGCPGTVNNTNENHSFCAVCLGKYDSNAKVPMGLSCGHTICRRCAHRLHPDFQGIPNVALLSFLESGMIPLPSLEPDCTAAVYRLSDIALVLKSHASSRAVHRKVLNLICSLTFNGQNKLCKASRAVGERVLIELSAACSHLSHYHAQQQLWGAIRARACQFMGPAMQEEALKLVLLALEDGSPLSRKVLVMFVVQRLAPQFPQASKTSIGHVIQLLYRASCFDVTKRFEASSLMTLRPEYRNYESLRREHDAQIVKIALESGIRFSPEQWSSILYGDSNHKPHMQSIIDKLQAPQTFSQMTTEFLVSIQRLTDSDDSNFLLSIHPRFQLLASIEVQPESPQLPWVYVAKVLDAVHCVLLSLFSFTPKAKPTPHHNSMSSQHRSSRLVAALPLTRSTTPQHPIQLTISHFPNSQSTSRGLVMNEFQRSTQSAHLQSNHFQGPSGSEIKELLAESRILRAKMKELQDKIPSSVALALQQEAVGLEEDVSIMVKRVSIH